ncbi:MAG: hypothetical protein ACFBWO_10345 [Paracoccaceae bacterium]
MDFDRTPEENAVGTEARAFLADDLPSDIAEPVKSHERLSRDDCGR